MIQSFFTHNRYCWIQPANNCFPLSRNLTGFFPEVMDKLLTEAKIFFRFTCPSREVRTNL
ncbi:BTB/POZ domain-containing proteinisoform X1 [Iris pallida]|uniref:BTB/POZ domain-containing proteinisoform X1 n=1 Tax=Iris pallida TaxID=29817 RepID=A0AAX6FM72_IRIPA|nr:BTB/POZ domain-containing proteinisoform X1 [Iris pallida]